MPLASSNDADQQRDEVAEQRRKVDFDEYNLSVRQLNDMLTADLIDIAPAYQRQFRWDDHRQSRLIESVMLGIPVPPLFMATNPNNHWEVVDGLQRLITLARFCGDQALLAKLHLTTNLVLTGLDKLPAFNGCTLSALPSDVVTAFTLRPVKLVVLNDKSELRVRFDLFERLNSGGIRLTDQEIRSCVFRGPFIDALGEWAQLPQFKTILHLPESRWHDGTPEELALRFFAFLERYQQFEHSVRGFLDDFAIDATTEPNLAERRNVFDRTFTELARVMPAGIKGRKGSTPINLFEGVAVGAALAMRETNALIGEPSDWINSSVLRSFTTGPTNSPPRVRGRIEFCRDRFLGR